MLVNLSIRNVSDDVVRRLCRQAERNHRSLQGELLAIIAAAVQDECRATPLEVLAEVRGLGLRMPSKAVELIRTDRDGR